MIRFLFTLLLIAGHCRPLLLTAYAASAQPAPNYAEIIRAAVLQGDHARVAEQCRAWYAGGTCSPDDRPTGSAAAPMFRAALSGGIVGAGDQRDRAVPGRHGEVEAVPRAAEVERADGGVPVSN